MPNLKTITTVLSVAGSIFLYIPTASAAAPPITSTYDPRTASYIACSSPLDTSVWNVGGVKKNKATNVGKNLCNNITDLDNNKDLYVSAVKKHCKVKSNRKAIAKKGSISKRKCRKALKSVYGL